MRRRALLWLAFWSFLVGIGQMWFASYLNSLIFWYYDWRKGPLLITSVVLFVVSVIVTFVLTVLAADRGRK